MATDSDSDAYDVVIIGAGIAGMYALVRFRSLGLRVRVFEAGSDVGGTWYWNRYPGARFDSESYTYAYAFDPEVLQEWDWSEHFAAQPETHRYLRYVADKHDMRKDIRFNARVASAEYQAEERLWLTSIENGEKVRSRFIVTAVGILSEPFIPDYSGRGEFTGRSWHTSRWPSEPVDLSDKRVAVIGTGATAVQLITEISKNIGHLTIFQRTANYAKPLRNGPIHPKSQKELKNKYPEMFERCRTSFAGFIHDVNPGSILEMSPAAQQEFLEEKWNEPGFSFWLSNFMDIFVDFKANEVVSEFVREKIRQRVDDPATAAKLIPVDHPFGTKRVPMESGYYEAFNRANVDLIDLKEDPIVRVTKNGIETTQNSYEFDVIIYATGFDSVTGSLTRMDIRGKNGSTLKKLWSDGPQTLFGLQVAGFPNLFTIVGPHNAGAFCNIPRCIEQNVDWIYDALAHLQKTGAATMEATTEAQVEWTRHVNEDASNYLITKFNSWFMGTNIPGKKRAFLNYLGGLPTYRARCDASAAAGYQEFVIT